MKTENENPAEDYLGNIADELGTMSGNIAEIKETQLSAATTEDVNTMGENLSTSVSEKVASMKESIKAQTQSVESVKDEVKNLTESVDRRLEEFTANPPVQKVEKTIRIAKESWQVYLSMFISVFTLIYFVAAGIWQEGRIEQCRTSDIKYHYILMNGGVNSAGLDSIEHWFHDPQMVKHIEAEVRAYEERVQETARALDQKQRLEEKINELNSQSKNVKK